MEVRGWRRLRTTSIARSRPSPTVIGARSSGCSPSTPTPSAGSRTCATSPPAINKHVRGAQEAGFVQRRKLGRDDGTWCSRTPIVRLQAWLGDFHAYWGADTASLDNYERYLATDPRLEKETL